jgi:hypothetical protein
MHTRSSGEAVVTCWDINAAPDTASERRTSYGFRLGHCHTVSLTALVSWWHGKTDSSRDALEHRRAGAALSGGVGAA